MNNIQYTCNDVMDSLDSQVQRMRKYLGEKFKV